MSYGAIISASDRGEEWEEAAHRLLPEMAQKGLMLDMASCNVAISACEKQGK